jgi:glycosyltransferase involved in cell wall biosynthesis
LTVLIPVLDEAETIVQAIEAVRETSRGDGDLEIIAIDGGSTDGSWELMEECARDRRLDLLIRQSAWGKGGAVMEGAERARGEVVAIFDADLEYSARDLLRVAEPVLAGRCQIGLGYRRRNALGMRRRLRWPDLLAAVPLDLGTFFLERIIRLGTPARFRDPFCMHRCWVRKLTPELPTGTPGFGWDLDMLLTALRREWTIVETPVDYFPRSYGQGKKLRPVRDSLDNLRVVARHRKLWRSEGRRPSPARSPDPEP